MQTNTESLQLKILHVLTLNGRNGEYGGPVRVARELCQELNSRGHLTHIFSGALVGSEPLPNTELSESFVHVKPITQKLKISSLWSWRLIPPLRKLISDSDIIHIHFARDLISFLAAFLSIILRKPFVTQTHGMIVPNDRFSTIFIDSFLTRPLINKSLTNLVLTQRELSTISLLDIQSPAQILPNGISVKPTKEFSIKSGNHVAFCSRLESRKGVSNFIKLADGLKNSGIKFEIYGPDGGELKLVQNEIQKRNLHGVLEYKGALSPDEVGDLLDKIDVLVLPSSDEPFPMVILESLAVGTAVLVMPSCGIADNLSKFNDLFVSKSEDFEGLLNSLMKLMKSPISSNERRDIQEFCKNEFGISEVCQGLVLIYRKIQNS